MKNLAYIHNLVISAFVAFSLFACAPGAGGGDDSTGLAALLLGPGSSTEDPTEPPATVLTVENPVFSPVAGSYSSTKDVTIETSTVGATIYYTDNGSDPQCPASTVGNEYTGSISVPTSITLKAIACKADMNPSQVITATYTIEGTVAAPTFSKAGGVYTSDLSVSLNTTTSLATIRYTTDGNDPDCSTPAGTLYSTPVDIAYPDSITLKAIACRTGFTSSSVTSASYDLTSTTPTVTVLPASGGYIGSSESITLQFSESMNTSSLAVSGTLGSVSSAWSDTSFVNDKVTLSPSSSWNLGMDKTLIVDINDLAGNPVSQINLTYSVIEGSVFYVSTTGSSSYDGSSPAQAFNSVRNALSSGTMVITSYDPFEYHLEYAVNPGDIILVAGGTYNLDSSSALDVIALKDGISVYGGFNSDFTDRDTGVYETILNDTCSLSCIYNPVGSTSISQSAVFDGFTVNAAAKYAMFIYNSSGLTISNNKINAGTATGSYNYTAGIYLDSSGTVIENNTIHGGTAEYATNGILVASSRSPVLRNNVIHGGIATGDGGMNPGISTGISSLGSPILYNNTVYGGDSTLPISLSLSNGSAFVENNIFFGDSTTTCVFETNTSPSSFSNNLLFGCGVYYKDYNTFNDFDTMCSGVPGNSTCTTTLSTPAATGNIDDDPVFTNQAGGDWHLNSGSPCGVTEGGIDLSSSFDYDLEGNARTTPFSIGAYEWDGSCN